MQQPTQNTGQLDPIQRLLLIQKDYDTMKAIAFLAINAIASPAIEMMDENDRILFTTTLTSLIKEMNPPF
jgi:hypothetical protein